MYIYIYVHIYVYIYIYIHNTINVCVYCTYVLICDVGFKTLEPIVGLLGARRIAFISNAVQHI